MNIITITFEKQHEAYTRHLTFPDGKTVTEQNIGIEKQWHSPEQYIWCTPLEQYSREKLVQVGNLLARVLLGQQGYDYINALSPQQPNKPILVLLENESLPEINRIPWEIACIGTQFIITNLAIAIIRQPFQPLPSRPQRHLHHPLKLLIVSASPSGQDRLHVEEELFKAAYALEEPMLQQRLIVDELYHCTREKLGEVLRCNTDYGYDILYFTGHGSFDGQTGYLVLEQENGTEDLVSARDVVTLLRQQAEPFALVFLSGCQTAMVGNYENTGKSGFGDVARQVLRMGVPHVIATQASIYENTGTTAMKTFFQELGHGFNPTSALLLALAQVDNDTNPFYDFYQFVHLSTLTGTETWAIRPRAMEQEHNALAIENTAYRSDNYVELDRNFVGRFDYISRIEAAWWNESVRVVGLHGLGGIGKTYLCMRMTQRAQLYAVPGKRLKQPIFIDFRHGVGHTFGGFLNQLLGIAHDLGFPQFAKVVEDNETYTTPLLKLRELKRWLDTRFEGRVLWILDNLESALDPDGVFLDPELGHWFRVLLGHSSTACRVLVTCRFRFDFFPDGRDLAEWRWLFVGELGITERLSLLNRWVDLRQRTWEEKTQILQTAGGHPYLIKLVLKYLQRHQGLPQALVKAAQDTATYARLDFFLSQLSPDALEWLRVAAVFPEPRWLFGLLNSRRFRDKNKDTDTLEKNLQQAMGEWNTLSLAGVAENEIQMDPLLVFQLLENEQSVFRLDSHAIEALRQAVGIFFLLYAQQTETRPERAAILKMGVETVLAQENMQLLMAYLQECAAVFLGFVPGSLFADIVNRVEERLLAHGEEFSFHTLEFCAQTLNQMRFFARALALFQRLLADSRLPEKHVGVIHHQMGRVYEEQRQWEPALEHYQLAIQWHEKTGNHVKLGSTFHQIGRVYEEQRQWEPALEHYQLALEWKEKTGNHVELGSTFHQIGMVYEEQEDISNALSFYKTGLLSLIQNENPDAEIIFSSLVRIFPKLTPEQVESLKDELGEEVVLELSKC